MAFAVDRDLKAENILLHANGSWVLCDFGSTTNWSGTYQTTNDVMMGEETIRKYTTPAYRAPEVQPRELLCLAAYTCT
jgi:AP2-associated kinase